MRRGTAVRLLFAARRLRQNAWIGMAIGFAAFAIAFAIRWSIHVNGLPFITFFPAVLAAGIFGGVPAGVITALLALIAARFYFVTPAFFTGLTPAASSLPLTLFAFASGVEILLAALLNRTIDELWDARERSNTLFRELQHRVANNLHFIAAILHLQRKSPQDKDNALASAQARIEVMGRIHRRLYDPANADRPVTDYLRDLGNDLIQSTGSAAVFLQITPSTLRLPFDTIVPISLIVAELMTNALKHAFHRTSEPAITISIEAIGDGRGRLTVSDNGSGNQPATDAPGLGHRIIESLARQIGATIETDLTQGTSVTLTFPLP